jgi:hypothetical protein
MNLTKKAIEIRNKIVLYLLLLALLPTLAPIVKKVALHTEYGRKEYRKMWERIAVASVIIFLIIYLRIKGII